jgi:hypothetical protein
MKLHTSKNYDRSSADIIGNIVIEPVRHMLRSSFSVIKITFVKLVTAYAIKKRTFMTLRY